MAAAYLSRHLPDHVKITVVGPTDPPAADALYGQLLPPEFYAFHLALGIDEPLLMQRTQSTFAYGGSVENWGKACVNWIQPFQLPLATLENVRLATLIAQDEESSLQPFLIACEAARAGRFAHPPEDSNHPLSRAEYGYLFDPNELTALYASQAKNVTHVAASVTDEQRGADGVASLQLDNGESLEADLFIDTTGELSADKPSDAPEFQARLTRTPVTSPELPLRRLRAEPWGWTSEVTLRNTRLRLDVGHDNPGSETFGFRPHIEPKPWQNNVIAIGQAALRIDPLTLAPLRLLRRDLERVVTLFPISTAMEIEAKAYNEVASETQVHALIYHQAHFVGISHNTGEYWARNSADPHPKLSRKLTQYMERGYLVGYDYESFEELDWAVLHDGLRRKPRRQDALANQVSGDSVIKHLTEVRRGIEEVVKKMPPHPLYLGKFLDYLRRTAAKDVGR
jgi:tryptophan halogenase